MKFGISFFPNVGPSEKSGRDYWNEALSLVDLCDPLKFSHVRTVEHYFHPYGGYSPNPMVFLSAASQRTRKARLVTGAVLPAFDVAENAKRIVTDEPDEAGGGEDDDV